MGVLARQGRDKTLFRLGLEKPLSLVWASL